jgi:hypothetical protein
MQSIYKYELAIADGKQVIRMPRLSMVLHADMRRGKLYLWALVDTGDVPQVFRTFKVYGTGEEILYYIGNMIHVSTVLTPDDLVWHVFEILE